MLPTFENIKESISKRGLGVDLDVIEAAYLYAKEAHQGQKRMSGDPYILHPVATAQKLIELKLDTETIAAGLLHDVPEDTSRTIDDIREFFGEDIAFLVDGITKLGAIKYRGMDRFAENLRKMFVAMAEDIRVVFIKFADRIHNLETLDALPTVKQRRIGQETIEIYAAIAKRLGMGKLQGELEDRAFPYAYPEEYQWLKTQATHQREEYKKLVNDIIKRVKKIIESDAIISKFELYGRVKRNYSLYKKLLKPKYDNDITQIYDIVAARIIVPEIKDCYHILGLIHQKYKPLPEQFKDYIAQPKPNGYQSLHTIVFTDVRHPVEFQIRTREMHEIAEYGIAAHFHFSETGKHKNTPPMSEDAKRWLEQLQKIHEEIKENNQFIETLKLDIFSNRIFIFTPKGDVIDLPDGANAIDFAYHIHSDVGDFCGGAKINGKLTDLTTPLKSGDVVEIIIEKKRAGPSKDWLDKVQTHTAKSKIRSALRKQHLNVIDRLLNR